MHNELIQQVADLMREQTTAFTRLDSTANQLTAALVRGEPSIIESLTRAGETELLRMRSRLLDITSTLTTFAEIRMKQTEKSPLNPEAREQFEIAAKSLIDIAKGFQKSSTRAANLAIGGSSFTSECVQMCGIPPTTYRAPVLKYYEGATR